LKRLRLGVDLGGTKIEIIALDDSGHQLLRRRIAPPVEARGLPRCRSGREGERKEAGKSAARPSGVGRAARLGQGGPPPGLTETTGGA